MSTGADATEAAPSSQTVTHASVTVRATPELASSLRDALANNPVALLDWSGPEVPLTLDDPVLLAWLRHSVGGVLTVKNA